MSRGPVPLSDRLLGRDAIRRRNVLLKGRQTYCFLSFFIMGIHITYSPRDKTEGEGGREGGEREREKGGGGGRLKTDLVHKTE